jgi:hypothetical protein
MAPLPPFKLTYIFYYLNTDDPEVSRHPWAVTHDAPKRNYDIMGLTVEDLGVLGTIPVTRGDELIGSWICDSTKSRITIYRVGNQYFQESLYSSGKPSVYPFAKIPGRPNATFKNKDHGAGADTYEVRPDGWLLLQSSGPKLFAKEPPFKGTD